MVTQPSKPSVDFTQFYSQNNRTSLNPTRLPSMAGAASDANMGFLGRTIDILSRPLRIISNPVMKAVELPERFDKVNELRLAGDDSAATKEALSAVGSLVAAPFTGFFSDNPDHKPYWSDIIERHSDVSNRNDPNYVDVANNVDPKTKGALGFVGDFILDPLWLVPYVGWGAKIYGTTARQARALKKEGITDFTESFITPGFIQSPETIKAAQAAAAAVGTRKTEEAFVLSMKYQGEQLPMQQFSSMDEAKSALAAEQRRLAGGQKPATGAWVDADKTPDSLLPTSNSFSISPITVDVPISPAGAAAAARVGATADNVPASGISDKLSEALLDPKNIKAGESSTEFVARTVGNLLNDAAKTPGGKNPLAEVLTDLAKVAAPPAKAVGKPATFNKWLTSALKDKTASDSMIQMPNSLTLRGVFGERASFGYVLKTYRDTKNTEIKDAIRSLILEPAYGRYAQGTKAGKVVNSIGNAASSAAALKEAESASSVAQLVNTLTKLDDANAARLGELMGEDFVALLRQTDPQGMNQFLDDFNSILLKTGTLEALGRGTPDSLLGMALGRFGIDPEVLARQVDNINQRINDIPTNPPQSLTQFAENIADNPNFQSSIREVLERLGYPAKSLDSLIEAGRKIEGIYDAVLRVAQKALIIPIRTKLDEKYLSKNYPFEAAGVKKNDPEFLKGQGVIYAEPSTYFQLDLFLKVAKDGVQNLFVGPNKLRVFSRANGSEFQGTQLAVGKERLSIAVLKVLEDLLTQKGVPLTFDYNGVFHNMRFTQAYEEVQKGLVANLGSDTARNLLTMVFFNAKTGTAPTQFMEAVASALSGGSKAEVRALLTSNFDRNGKAILSTERKPINFLSGKTKTGKMTPTNITNTQLADSITDAIMTATPSLKTISRSNAEDLAARANVEGKVITQDVGDYLVGLINSPDKLGEAIRAVANSERVVGDFARAVDATELGASVANAAVSSGVGAGLKNTAKEFVNLERATVSGDPKKVQAAQKKMFDSAEEFQARIRREAQEISEDAIAGRRQLDGVPPGPVEDVVEMSRLGVGDQIATSGFGTIQAMLAKIIDPLNKFFNMKAGMHANQYPWGHRLFAASANHLHSLAAALFQPLRAITQNKAFMARISPESNMSVTDQAFRNIQKNIRSTEGTVLREAEDALRPLIAKFFDTTDEVFNQILGNVFFRTGAGIDAVNNALAMNKVLGNKTPPTGIYFDKDLAEQTVRARVAREAAESNRPAKPVTDDDVLREMYNQWRTWDVDNSIEFLSSIHKAVVQTAVENSFAVGFRQKALATGVASPVPKKDFVKFTFAEDSRYAAYFGDEPLYLLPDAAEMLEAIDKFYRTSKTFEGAFGRFTREVLDPFTDVWKYAVTLPRPGHHTRNMVGDVTLTYLAEGGFAAVPASRHAIKSMSLKGSYADVDVAKLLTGSGLEMPKDSTVAISGLKLKGGTVDLTYGQVMDDLFIRQGVLPPAKGREGLRRGRGFDEGEMGDPAFARMLEKGVGFVNPLALRGGKIEDIIMDIAEGRDHFVRMQHAWQILEKAKAGKPLTAGFGRTVNPRTMTQEELFVFVADRVAKYHPDLSTLAVGERKYLKRLMPFYHWNRGAFQAVMETAVMNPARISAFPKASYNIAIAAGVNPYSLYDPFPTDQMFPSFLQDEIQGPQFEVGGKYYGVRPGVVTFDVLNQLRSGNPVDAIMSNLNPAFKIPLELLTGTRIDTGSRIRDYSDYIDAAIPGVNYAANVSGYSVTGSLAALLTGGGFDRQLQYELGNRGTEEQLTSALNWLTGIGLVDYSRPTFIRYAQNEFRRENAPDTGRSPF